MNWFRSTKGSVAPKTARQPSPGTKAKAKGKPSATPHAKTITGMVGCKKVPNAGWSSGGHSEKTDLISGSLAMHKNRDSTEIQKQISNQNWDDIPDQCLNWNDIPDQWKAPPDYKACGRWHFANQVIGGLLSLKKVQRPEAAPQLGTQCYMCKNKGCSLCRCCTCGGRGCQLCNTKGWKSGDVTQEETRVDTADGVARTRDGLHRFYNGYYSSKEIDEYWESMLPSRELSGLAGAVSVGTGKVDIGNGNRVPKAAIQNTDQTKSTKHKQIKHGSSDSSFWSDATNDSGVTASKSSKSKSSNSKAGESEQIRTRKKGDKKASQEQPGAKVKEQVDAQKRKIKMGGSGTRLIETE